MRIQRNLLRGIRAAANDHILMGIGLGMYIGGLLLMRLLSKQYADPDNLPSWIARRVAWMTIGGMLVFGIGAFLFLCRQMGASSWREYPSAFAKGLWKVVKLPLLLSMLIGLGILFFAYFSK